MDGGEKQRLLAMAEQLRNEQSYVAAVISGVIAMILASAIFGVASAVATSFWYSLSALVLGVLIGLTMQFLGRGVDVKFAVTGFVLAALAAPLSNVTAVFMRIARVDGESPLVAMSNAELSELFRYAQFEMPMTDIMLWTLGAGGAAYFARRALTREQGHALHTWKAERDR